MTLWNPVADKAYLNATNGVVAPEPTIRAVSISLFPAEVELQGGDVISEIAIRHVQANEQLIDTSVGDFFVRESIGIDETGEVTVEQELVVDVFGSDSPELAEVVEEDDDPLFGLSTVDDSGANFANLNTVTSTATSVSSTTGTTASPPSYFTDPVWENDVVSPSVTSPNSTVTTASVDPTGAIELETVAAQDPPPPLFNDPYWEAEFG